MSSVRVIRYIEYDPGPTSFSPSTYSQGSIGYEQSGTGQTWFGSSSSPTIQLTSSNKIAKPLQQYLPSQRLRAHSTGIPATKCIVNLEGSYGFRIEDINSNYSNPPRSGDANIIFTVEKNYREIGSQYLTSTHQLGNTSIYYSPYYSGFTQTGSDVQTTTPNQDTIAFNYGGNLKTDNTPVLNLRISINKSGVQNYSIYFYMSSGMFFRGTTSWEGTNHTIDGVGGDTIPTLSTVSTFSAVTNVTKNASLSLTSSYSFAESSTNTTFGDASCSTVFSMDVTPLLITSTSVFLESSFELIASTNNLVFFDDLIISSEFNISSVATIKFGAIEDFSVTANTSTNAGLIYDLLFLYTWNSFNLNTFFISGYVIEGYSSQDEYTWDDLANDAWDLYTFDTWEGKEQSWDGWPFDVWGRTFDLPMVATTVEQGNIVRDSVANFLGQFFVEENSALQETAQANFVSEFTLDGQPSGVLTGEASISSESSLEEIGNVILGGSADLSSALSFSIDVKLITDIIETENSVFSFAVTPTVKRTSSADVSSQFTVDVTGARIYRATVAITSAMAFAVEVTFVTQADPYFTIKVAQEIRTHVVPADSRVLLICQENRVNTPVHESRVLLVEQETRLHYLLIPPLTNIKSTPYERAI